MRIEFDPAKNLRNASERGLGLERAADFDFGTALVWQDTRKSYPEVRYIALGFLDARLHVLCLRTCSMSFWSRVSTWSGWAARRGAQWIARLSTSATTPQTARQGTCPKGWGAIGRLGAPAACMGMSPCGAPGPPTHPDCTPNAISQKTLNTF